MLLGNFFNISEQSITDNSINATLDINASHHIFDGHFPGQPVVPGVCMMQMIKELLEAAIGKKTQLRKADFMKFLAVINPLENPTINAEFSYSTTENGGVQINGRLNNHATTFLKFKGSFIL